MFGALVPGLPSDGPAGTQSDRRRLADAILTPMSASRAREDDAMEMNAGTLVDAALEMSTADRARIAAALLDSLDGPTDPDVEAAWADEIARRVAQIKSGEVSGRSWDEVKARAREASGR